MKTPELPSTSSSVSVHTEQPASVPLEEKKDLTNNFFLIGGVINILIIMAYFVWAFGAWKRADKQKER